MRERLFAAALLAAFAIRAVSVASSKSATFDEPFNLALGAAFLSGDYSLRQNKPVLSMALQALPAQVAGAQAPSPDEKISNRVRALRYLHENTIPAERILFLGRMVNSVIALLLGLVVYLAGRRLFGPAAGLSALTLFTLCPNVAAHAGLATEDIVVTACFFLAVSLFDLFLEQPTPARGACLGLAVGAAFMSKYSGLALVPILPLIATLDARRHRLKAGARPWLAAAGGLAGAFLLVYGTGITQYLLGFEENNAVMTTGQMTFFNGFYSNQGLKHYFLGVLALKTPLPILIALGAALWPAYRRGLAKPTLLVPIALFLGVCSFSRLQLGFRYILLVYPFLLLIAGAALSRLPRLIAGALLLALALESSAGHPDHLAYANQLAGGSRRAWRYMVDSNLDWGQDLGGLRDYVRDNNVSDVILSYYGCTVPDAIGFPFQNFQSVEIWGEASHLNNALPRREILAVSVTQLQALYLVGPFGFNPLKWAHNLQPIAVIGGSIRIYDITTDAQAHERLAHAYFVAGQLSYARREAARALVLNPGSAWASILSAFCAKNPQEASRFFHRLITIKPGELPFDEFAISPRTRSWYRRGFKSLAHEAARRGEPRLQTVAHELATRLK